MESQLFERLEFIRDVIASVAGTCYYSPLVESTVEGIHGLRFFFGNGKSILLEYLNTVDDIIGFELFMGLKNYADSPGEILVTFRESRALAQILPFVKDFLAGNILEEGGIYLSKT